MAMAAVVVDAAGRQWAICHGSEDFGRKKYQGQSIRQRHFRLLIGECFRRLHQTAAAPPATLVRGLHAATKAAWRHPRSGYHRIP